MVWWVGLWLLFGSYLPVSEMAIAVHGYDGDGLPSPPACI